jgi:putative protease
MGLLDFLKNVGSSSKKKKENKSTKAKKKAKPKAKKPAKKYPSQGSKLAKKKITSKTKTKKIQKHKPTAKAAPKEKEIGCIIHYFRKISVGIIKLKDQLKVGDKIHIKGAHDDFSQIVRSMQYNHKDIPTAKKGLEVGVKMSKKVHENDKVYRIVSP